MTSRRIFLRTASTAALAGAAAHRFPAWAADPPEIIVPGTDGMIVRSYRFLDLETPVKFMTEWITPVNHFFVRNHMFEPARIDVKTWKVGKHVMFRGLDEVPGKVPPFIRSIPIEKAIDADTLVATHMNGAPLTQHHGFPARVVTPGWAGAASCKWLTEITVLDKPAEGNFMNPGYRVPNTPVKPGEASSPRTRTRLRV